MVQWYTCLCRLDFKKSWGWSVRLRSRRLVETWRRWASHSTRSLRFPAPTSGESINRPTFSRDDCRAQPDDPQPLAPAPSTRYDTNARRMVEPHSIDVCCPAHSQSGLWPCCASPQPESVRRLRSECPVVARGGSARFEQQCKQQSVGASKNEPITRMEKVTGAPHRTIVV